MADDKKDNRFTLLVKYNILKQYIDTYIISSIPKVHNDIRIHLIDEVYKLYEYICYASYTKGNVRLKYLVDIQVRLSLIDMLLNSMRDSYMKKKIDKAISLVNDIKNIIYGWKFNEEKAK